MYVFQADTYCDSCGRRLVEALEADGVQDHGDSDGFPQSALEGETDYVDHCASGADCLEAVDLGDYGLEDGAPLYGAETRTVGAILTDSLTDAGVTYTRELVDDNEAPTPYQEALHRLWREVFPEILPDVQSVARTASQWFEGATRDDSTRYVRVRGGAPHWITDLVYEAHGDMLPDDWRYATIAAALDHIAETGDEDPAEFADGRVDVYTGARLEWLSSHLSRPGYCDEARDEFGADDSGDIVAAIGLGQYLEASEVFGLVLGALEARAEELAAA